MSLKIRLARGGAKKRPYYSIVVADSRSPRDGRFIEKLGTYNPMLDRSHADRVTLKSERIQHWLGVGALPTARVARFLEVPEDGAGYGPREDETGRRPFDLRLCGIAKGGLIARLPGIGNRDQAEALRGLRLYLPRSALPQPAPEAYYHADLIGLDAV